MAMFPRRLLIGSYVSGSPGRGIPQKYERNCTALRPLPFKVLSDVWLITW